MGTNIKILSALSYSNGLTKVELLDLETGVITVYYVKTKDVFYIDTEGGSI